jgi:hypothetical protein
MAEQNYKNHRQIVPMYHIITFLVLLATIIGAIVNLVKSAGTPGIYSASLILVTNLCLFSSFILFRVFALKAQDRAIRAEENLRHFVLTNALLDPRLTIRQVIGLRFAKDEEFIELAKEAAEKNISENDIKKSIKNWRADIYRV